LFKGRIGDGTRLIAFGVTKAANSGPTNRVYITSIGAEPIYTYVDVAPSGDDFFNLRLVKEGTTGGAGDMVKLYADGVLLQTSTYINFDTLTSRELLFGTVVSPAFGTRPNDRHQLRDRGGRARVASRAVCDQLARSGSAARYEKILRPSLSYLVVAVANAGLGRSTS